MFDRFTARGRRVFRNALSEAQRLDHDYIGTEHILVGLVQDSDGVLAKTVKDLDLDLEAIRKEMRESAGVDSSPTSGQLPFDSGAKALLEYTFEEAYRLHHNFLEPEHLLLGLVRDENCKASQVLMNLGAKLEI